MGFVRLVLIVVLLYAHVFPVNGQQNCLHFDGAQDFVKVNAPFNEESDFTIETWVFSENKAVCGGGKYLRFLGWKSYNLELAVCGESLRFYDGSSWKNTKTEIKTDQWYHVAITRKKPTYSIYVNGELVLSYENTRKKDLSGYFSIGSSIQNENSQSEFWKGAIDEFRIWNFPKSEDEIKAFMNKEAVGNENGLIGHFHFNQGLPERSNTNVGWLENDAFAGENGQINGFKLQGSNSNFIYSNAPIQGEEASKEYLRPTIKSPTNGRIINPDLKEQIRFSWEGISRNVRYIFKLYEFSTEDSLAIALEQIEPKLTRSIENQNFIEISTRDEFWKDEQNYTWKVEAIDEEGFSICLGDCASGYGRFSLRGSECGIEITNVEVECRNPFFENGIRKYRGCITFTNPSTTTLSFGDPGSGLFLFNSSSVAITGLSNVDPFPVNLVPGGSAKVCFDLDVTQGSIRLQVVADDIFPDPLVECIAKDAINVALPFCLCDECETEFIIQASNTATIEKSNSPDFDWLNINALVKGSNPVVNIQAELAFFQMESSDGQCLICSPDNRQYANFVEPGPYNEIFHPTNPAIYTDFQSQKGKVISGDGSTISRLLEWKSATLAGVDISGGIFLNLGMGIPKLPDLDCCGYRITACIRYTLMDQDCRVCHKLACVTVYEGQPLNSNGGNGNGSGIGSN